MYFAILFIVALSLAFQVAAVFLALRLIRITGTNMAWMAISLGMLAAAIRRTVAVVGLLIDPRIFDRMDIWSESLGLLVSILLFVGLASIGPLFRTIQQAKQTIEQARDRLEQEVRQRTAELVRANEELQAEFAQRAKAEEALRDEHRKFRHIVRLNERDQQLLAYDIHDGFVQPATAALMTLQAGLAAYKTEPDKTLEHVVLALQLLQESMSQVRWLISGLRPVILEEQGLVAAIDKLVDDTAGCTEIRIEWLHRVEFDRLAPTLEMSLFRIIQEALRNAVRHSGTNRIEIALIQSGGSVKATIRDWGAGFDPSVQKEGHFGLKGMKERARLFGGTAQIESSPAGHSLRGSGTCVTAEFPLLEQEEDSQA